MVAIAAAGPLTGCASPAPAAARPAAVAGPEVPASEWFAQTGCTDCHSVSAYRIWNLAATGPDLSLAVEDVPRRFGRSLEDFLHAPTGTMAMVLSSRIPLTPSERDTAILKLEDAYRQHLLATGRVQPVSSH